jgi:hypothetical protein
MGERQTTMKRRPTRQRIRPTAPVSSETPEASATVASSPAPPAPDLLRSSSGEPVVWPSPREVAPNVDSLRTSGGDELDMEDPPTCSEELAE